MACYGCATKFSFFQKEVACAKCGFGFCSKCLKQKAVVPNKSNTELSVCRQCFIKLNSNSTSNDIRPPPDIFLSSASSNDASRFFEDLSNPFTILKHPTLYINEDEEIERRLENLENPSVTPITLYTHSHNSHMERLRTGLSEADQRIADRLERLRSTETCTNPPPSEAELRRRLAQLRSENYYSGAPNKSTAFQPDLRSDQQKVDALLEQYSAERDIQLATDPASEIEARLATLRDAGVRPNATSYLKELHDIDSSDDESQVDKITRKIMDEVAIEKSVSSNESGTKKAPHPRILKHMDRGTPLHASTPELTLCVICHKNASQRCIDCGNELFCAKCFTEIHRDWSETDHKSVPYKPRSFTLQSTSNEDEDEDDDLSDEDDS